MIRNSMKNIGFFKILFKIKIGKISHKFGLAPCWSKYCNIVIWENDAATISKVGFLVHAPLRT